MKTTPAPASWIDLSQPSSVTLSKEMDVDDRELAQFLAASNGKFRYDYVRLGCTFHQQHPERFEKAWLRVTLKPGKGETSNSPIAWSIYPTNSYDKIEEGSSTKISSKFHILSAEVADTVKLSKKLYYLRGYKEGAADPFWEMNTTESTSLEGMFRFHLIVRSLAKSTTQGEVRLETVISDRLFAVFRSSKPFDQAPTQEFQIPIR